MQTQAYSHVRPEKKHVTNMFLGVHGVHPEPACGVSLLSPPP